VKCRFDGETYKFDKNDSDQNRKTTKDKLYADENKNAWMDGWEIRFKQQSAGLPEKQYCH